MPQGKNPNKPEVIGAWGLACASWLNRKINLQGQWLIRLSSYTAVGFVSRKWPFSTRLFGLSFPTEGSSRIFFNASFSTGSARSFSTGSARRKTGSASRKPGSASRKTQSKTFHTCFF